MGRHSCCVKQKLRKGLWSPEEDEKLFNYISRFGVGCWSSVPQLAGLQRCGKSCRLRWINYLRPDLKRGMFSQQEESLIISLHQALGNRWAQIAAQLPGRTDNEIKNFWNSCLKKKLMKQGIDPTTHKPITRSQMEVKEERNDNTTDMASLPIISNFNVHEPAFLIDTTSYNNNSNNTGSSIHQQVNDPLLGYEFQAMIDQSIIIDQSSVGLPSFYNPTSQFETSFSSMPSLASFDFSENSGSKMSSSCSNSSINNNNNNNNNMNNYNTAAGYQNLIENAAAGNLVSWDANNVDNTIFQYPVSGLIKTDEDQSQPIVSSSPWQDQNSSIVDFNNYSIKSLSEDLITGADFDVFHHI